MISVDWDGIHRPVETARFMVYSEMDRNVGILRMFPGITRATVRGFGHVGIISIRFIGFCF